MHKTCTGIRGSLPSHYNREKFLSEATRATFITRQDARNIVRTMDNALRHRHKNDAISVQRLVGELQKEDSLVVAYKPQGIIKEEYPQLREESFLLVIMTTFQAQMFKKHSGRIVCVDSTHNTNPYGFKLVTVVVPDEFKNGKYYSNGNFKVELYVPCIGLAVAWAIIDREDVDTLGAVFKSVHDHVPDASVNTLMTDDGELLYSYKYLFYGNCMYRSCITSGLQECLSKYNTYSVQMACGQVCNCTMLCGR